MAFFGKVSTAMVTPFNHAGQVDFERTTKLVEHLLSNGSDSLVVCGTTGESPTLSKQEKLALFKHVVKVVDGRVKVIAGTGSNNTEEAIQFTQMAAETGVDAVMLVTPYYNKPSQEGLYQHFKAIAESVELPVMVYNVPGRTVTNLLPETIVRLSAIQNIIAVKEASGNIGVMTKIIAGTPDNFELYCGDDGLTLPAMAVGATGVVSVASHIIGTEMQEIIQHFESGRNQEAAQMHQKYLPLMEALFSAPSPAPTKAALNFKGVEVGSVRLPLVEMNQQEVEELKKFL